MGRKIPAKKHRGVKDPLEQQARRLQSIKEKINAPPKDPDDQPVPRSLTRLFAFQGIPNSSVKKRSKPKRTHPKGVVTTSGTSENPVAKLKKLPGESGRGFSLRINSAMRALHNPLEQHYPQDLEAEDVKGEQMAAQRARRKRRRARGGRGGGDGNEEPDKLTRAQKLASKRNARKEKAAEEEAQGGVMLERVAFGEVAHAPPALPALPALPGRQRPGRRQLLLSALLQGGERGAERARLDAVAAYRRLKREKLQRQPRASRN